MRTLEGSCHCGAVTFTVKSHTPQPYMHCYCSICRKTAGGGGYAIIIMGEARTLTVTGRKHLAHYRAKLPEDGKTVHSPARRHFCKRCGSALFISDPRWPKWVYPHASAIDTPLPKPKERQLIFLESRPDWAFLPEGRKFRRYPREAIIDWHGKRGLLKP